MKSLAIVALVALALTLGAVAYTAQGHNVELGPESGLEDIDTGRGRGGGGGPGASCGGPPGWYIRILFNNHDSFNWSYAEYPENMTVEWTIEAPTPWLAEVLEAHVEQMECILENGGTPRAMDPVFWLEAQVKEYIDTEVDVVNGSIVKIVKKGDNMCAYETIRLHAEVVKGFFERGIEEARQIHPVPDEVWELCQPYIGN